MNIFAHFGDLMDACLDALEADGTLPTGLDRSGLSVEPPRQAEHGDIATNAALVLARPAGMAPRELAAKLAGLLERADEVAGIEVAGPGFINIRLEPAYLRTRLRDVLVSGPKYGSSEIGAGRKVNVEYVSANPTGPLHVGHCRGAVFGDALAALLEKAGFEVLREYYINDAGAQIDVLARSVHMRYREALGEGIGAIEDGLYPGDYLKPVGAEIAARDGDKWRNCPESDWLGEFRQVAVTAMMALIRDDLAALGVRQDVFTSERALHGRGAVDRALKRLEDRGLIYTGVLEPPKGQRPDDWEARPQTLFRATRFGDDVDRPLRKSDGSWTYFASDIAYHLDKFKRGYATMIDVWGADHGGYVKRMKAAVAALTEGRGRLDVRLCQMVRLFRAGTPVKMSKRAGQFVTLREVIDEVGRDVVRFIMLTRKNDAPLDFDFVQVMEQSRDNPVFYVQYAHARARSLMRKAAGELPTLKLEPKALMDADLALLTEPEEIDLIQALVGWPRQVEAAALAHEPHRIAFYLYELASRFHLLWNKGNDDPRRRFIISDRPELSRARLALVQGMATVVASGLAIMGVVPVEEMH